MLVSVVRELKSHHFSDSRNGVELQNKEIGQTPGKEDRDGDCVVLQEVILSLAGHDNPAGVKQTTVPTPLGQLLPAIASHRPTPSILPLIASLKCILKIDGSFI